MYSYGRNCKEIAGIVDGSCNLVVEYRRNAEGQIAVCLRLEEDYAECGVWEEAIGMAMRINEIIDDPHMLREGCIYRDGYIFTIFHP